MAEKIIRIKQATKKGYIEMKSGGVCDVSYPTSKLRRGRVQGGGDISPTLTCSGDAIVRIEVMEDVKERFFKQALETLEQNDCEVGDVIQAFNNQVLKDGVSPTITTRPDGFKTSILPVVKNKDKENKNMETVEKSSADDYAIRKLTPRECFRLMGFKDRDFDAAKNAGVSNSQLYKQAGNSIVAQVLMAIFLQLGIQGKKKWNQMSVEDRQQLVDSSLDFLEK